MNIRASIALRASFVRTIFYAALSSYVFVLRSSPVRALLGAFVSLVHTKATRKEINIMWPNKYSRFDSIEKHKFE